MTSEPLETLRQKYQDIEINRRQAVHLLNQSPKTIKEAAYINHHVAEHCQNIKLLSKEILTLTPDLKSELSEDPIPEFYEKLEMYFGFHSSVVDNQKNAKEAIEKQNQTAKTMNDLVFDIQGAPHLSLFYDNDRYQEWMRQRKLKPEKKRNKKRQIIIDEEDEAFLKFSGEECFGKFLDLNSLHSDYLEFCGDESVSYIDYLENLSKKERFSKVPSGTAGDQYLNKLFEYLINFLKRSNPFVDIETLEKQIASNFQRVYVPKKQNALSCVYCSRSFNSQEEYDRHITLQSHKRKVLKASNSAGGLEQIIEAREQREKDRSKLEYSISFILDSSLKGVLNDTLENARRRTTLSAAVLEAEQQLDAPIAFDEDEDDNEEEFFNPKGLPLGWDGKPIPLWLYKLHGLSHEYKCEICGNRSYWGIVAFERHFFEAKHIAGLRALGIPPTQHFVYVTEIKEAVELFGRIKKELKDDVWEKGDEEIELENGTVMSRKVYNNLVRQGIKL